MRLRSHRLAIPAQAVTCTYNVKEKYVRKVPEMTFPGCYFSCFLPSDLWPMGKWKKLLPTLDKQTQWCMLEWISLSSVCWANKTPRPTASLFRFSSLLDVWYKSGTYVVWGWPPEESLKSLCKFTVLSKWWILFYYLFICVLLVSRGPSQDWGSFASRLC